MLFSRRVSPHKIAFSVEESRPHLLHGSYRHTRVIHKRNLDRFSRFCRAHERDQQTDRHTKRHTDHATPSVAIGRVYLLLRVGLKRLKMTVTVHSVLYSSCKSDIDIYCQNMLSQFMVG